MAYKAKEEAVSPPNRLGPSKSAASAPERLGVRAERAGPLAHRESRGHWRLGSSSGAAYPPGSRGPLRELLLPQSRRMSKTPYPAPTSPEDQIAAWLLSVCLCRPPAGHYIGPTSGGSTRWEHARHGWVGAGVGGGGGGGSGQKGAGRFYQQSPASTTRLRHEASVRGECYKQKKAPHIARPRRMPPAQSKKGTHMVKQRQPPSSKGGCLCVSLLRSLGSAARFLEQPQCLGLLFGCPSFGS